MKRYPYQGDLAKVVDVEVSAQRAEIQFVPRLDYIEVGQRMTSASLNEDGTQRKKGAKKQTGVRLPARSVTPPPLPRPPSFISTLPWELKNAGICDGLWV